MAKKRSSFVICVLLIYYFVLVNCNFEEIEAINRRLDDLLKGVNKSDFSENLEINNQLFADYEIDYEDINREGNL